MSGRIRSIKPEWLEDEKLAAASDEARLLSVALLLLADDHGRGRAHIAYICSRVWPYSTDRREPPSKATRALKELVAIGFIRVYEVGSQRYFAITNWGRHQRVDKPSPPRIPEPPQNTPDLHVGSIRERGEDGSRTFASGVGGVAKVLATDLDLDLDLDPDQEQEECAEVADASPPSPAVLEIPCSGKIKSWTLTAAKVAEYAESFPGVDVLAVCRRARQWQIDHEKERKTAGKMAAWLSSVWLGREQDRGGRGGIPPPGRADSRPPPRPDPTYQPL